MVSIGAQLEGGATVDELLSITDDSELAAKLQIDVSQVGEARQQLQTLKDTGDIQVPVTVKLDETQFNTLTQTLSGEPVEIPAEVETPEVPDVSGEEVTFTSTVELMILVMDSQLVISMLLRARLQKFILTKYLTM